MSIAKGNYGMRHRSVCLSIVEKAKDLPQQSSPCPCRGSAQFPLQALWGTRVTVATVTLGRRAQHQHRLAQIRRFFSKSTGIDEHEMAMLEQVLASGHLRRQRDIGRVAY